VEISINPDYRQVLDEIKLHIRSSQLRAVLAANSELIGLYWHIGHSIVTLQAANGWGTAVVKQMAADLRTEHPGIQGFSRTSLFAMRQMYIFFSHRYETVPRIVGQLGGQLYDFQRKPRFPKKATPEFLLVDLVNNLEQLAEDRDAVLARVLAKVSEMDAKRLQAAVKSFAKVATRKLLEEALANAA